METFEVRFVKGGNSEQYCVAGWSTPEDHGTWTDGYEAVLRLPCPAGRCDMVLSANAGPCLAPPAVVDQELVARVNGRELYRARSRGDTRIAFRVPAELVPADSSLEVKFLFPHAFSRKALGLSMDHRALGFAFWNLELRPVASTPEAVPPVWDNVRVQQPTIAAVTMVYNERDYLPIWLRHYARQVGPENCFVVDHGSSDGSTAMLDPSNVIRIPRSAYDPHKQSKWNSEFCSSLLNWYDWVIYSDVDELVMPDPRAGQTLRDYSRRPLPETVTAIGLNVIHRPGAEPEIDLGRPVTLQRQYVFFASAMCKPLLTRRSVTWSPGSHSSDAPVAFDDLYAFHLRWFDLSFGLRRLQFQRAMAWARLDAGTHARVDDARLAAMYEGFARLPCLDGIDFSTREEPVRSHIEQVIASAKGRETSLYKIDLDIWPTRLWHLPPRFIGAF